MEVLGAKKDEIEKIGGIGMRVKVDETAICNGLVIINPSNHLDDHFNIQWIIGGVIEGDCKKFFFELVLNHKSETIKQVFEKYIYPGSIIVTDRYPSYPCAVTQFGSVHNVVNHSLGFATATGTNTNQIENMWSHLKQDYRGRHGLNHNRIHLFLREFS